MDRNVFKYEFRDLVFFDETIKELILCKKLNSQWEITREIVGESKRDPIKLTEIPHTNNLEDVKLSPDGKFLGIKRKEESIEIVPLLPEKLASFVHTSKRKKDPLLGFYWTYPSNLLLVTKSGFELYSIFSSKSGNSVKLIKEYKKNINWFVYSPIVRILLLSCSSKTSILQGFHFMMKKNGVMKLPKFDLFPKNTEGSVHPSEIFISQIYNALYCIHVNDKASKRELVLYHLSNHSVVAKHHIDLHTDGIINLSVIDNLIIAHNIDQQISMIFDIKLKELNFPAAAPLPLPAPPEMTQSEVYKNWRFYLPGYVNSTNSRQCWKLELNLDAIAASFSDRVKLADFLIRRVNSKELILKTIQNAIVEKESLTVLGAIFEMLSRVLAMKELGRDGKGEGSARDGLIEKQDTPVGTGALTPQGPPPPSTPAPPLPPLSPEKVERTPSAPLSPSSVDIALKNSSYYWQTFVEQHGDDTGSRGTGADTPGPIEEEDSSSGMETTSLSTSNPVRVGGKFDTIIEEQNRVDGQMLIEQEDMYTRVFNWVEEQNAVDFKYLVAVIVEYIRSLNFQYLSVKSFIYEIVIRLLVQNNRFYQLHQFIQYHVISDSQHVAYQLLYLGKSYPPAYQLALDMLKRAKPTDILEVLLTKGQVIQALRYVISNSDQVKIEPQRFFEAAMKSEDETVFYTVYNHFKKQEVDVSPYEAAYKSKYEEN
uniref:Uncharacterized protein n=1 Tax=Arcella intermedia TaxID=1963864 RepID=A0A6B2KYX7_9EUKA